LLQLVLEVAQAQVDQLPQATSDLMVAGSKATEEVLESSQLLAKMEESMMLVFAINLALQVTQLP
jgi:hypothetical protein